MWFDSLKSAHDNADSQPVSTRGPTVTSELSISRDVDAGIQAWRLRMLNILLGVYSVATLVPLIAILGGRGLDLPWSLRNLCLLLYLTLLLATVRMRWSMRARAHTLLAISVAMGTIQLTVGQLSGHGRISLMLMPLLALLLVGPRTGWAALALSATLFALVPLALQPGGGSDRIAGVHVLDAPLAYWGLQWILWMIAMLILMILFTRFQILQRRSMIAERQARRQLEAESADRQRLEAAIDRIGEEERRRLGAELHDGLCQHLTAALLNCSAMENQRRAEGAPDAVALTQLRVALADSIGMAYDVAKGLCPMDIDPDALIPALERLCRETRDRHGIDCRLQADRDLAIRNSEYSLHLYRIAREAVANAAKHAKCSQISIALDCTAGELVLQVTDDGRGAVPGVAPAAGLGLGIMKHRAKLIGGTLLVAGGPNGGMQVVCRVPEKGVSA